MKALELLLPIVAALVVMSFASYGVAAEKPSPEPVTPMKDLASVKPAHGTASIKPAGRWEYAF